LGLLQQLAMAYGWAAGSISLLNNIWVTYNYPFFISGPLASGSWFVVVQMIFLVWNSINDPIFGMWWWIASAWCAPSPPSLSAFLKVGFLTPTFERIAPANSWYLPVPPSSSQSHMPLLMCGAA
jgi:hypothetical protein